MAGRVRKALGEREAVAVSRLAQILKQKGEVVYQALSWLVREDEIDFYRKKGETFVSQSHEERERFKESL